MRFRWPQGGIPFANPVFHSMSVIEAFLLVTGTSYTTYFSGAQFVHFLLGPATVALAVPLYENRGVVASAILPMLVALAVGCATAIVSVVLLAQAFSLPRGVVLSLAPKSVTAGVAMGISESLGADAPLTAVAVILTGIMGAMIVTPPMNRMGITDFRARGFAVGLASHGIGTARAFQVDAVAGVFAGIAMSLNALVTFLLVPLAVTLLVRGCASQARTICSAGRGNASAQLIAPGAAAVRFKPGMWPAVLHRRSRIATRIVKRPAAARPSATAWQPRAIR
jgi:putative effector of murein hydrolase